MSGPVFIQARSAPLRERATNYPAPYAARVAGRQKRPLGDVFGLKNFGVNLTRLVPGAESSLFHRHSRQDEFVYILEGQPTLVTDSEESLLKSGDCTGFPAGGTAHHLINRTTGDVIYLEIGDRTPGDEGSYPKDDISTVLGSDGAWRFQHKDGTPY